MNNSTQITVPLEPFIVTGTIMRVLVMLIVLLSIRCQRVIGSILPRDPFSLTHRRQFMGACDANGAA